MLRKTILSAAILIPVMAHAAGLSVYEMGTSDLGYAGAGTAARAEDASTVYANPAGMTRLQGNQLTVAGQVLYGKLDYKLDGTGALAGSNPQNAVGWVPGGSAFYSHSLSDRLKLGVAVYNDFGAALDLGNNWAGRNISTYMEMISMTVQPTVAYRLSDNWSLGAGLRANYGLIKLDRIALTGAKRKQEDSDWEYSARLGVMYEPSKSTRFGLVWTDKIEYDYSFNPTFTGPAGRIHTVPVGIMFNAPQQVMTSVFHRLNDTWALTGNIGWQDWSRFSDVPVEVGGAGTTLTLPLQDTWHAAFGAQYTYNAKTKVSAGMSYDTSFYKHQNQTSFMLPSGAAWRFGTGVQYVLSPKSDLGLAFEYLRMDSSSDPSTLVSGKYNTPEMFFMALNYMYRF